VAEQDTAAAVTNKPKPKVDPNLILSSQVAQGMAVIGDRYAFMIIRDIYLGVRQFEGLRIRSGAARGTLASRLKTLVNHGILYKNPYQSSPTRYEYRLTDKGLDLYPVVLMMWNWETKWGNGRHLPPTLTHKACGEKMHPLMRCSQCHKDAMPQDIIFSAGKDVVSAKKIPPRFQRRSKVKDQHGDEVDQRFFTVLDVVGDRWTSLVIAAAFFGLQRFDEIGSSIGIATNILADRLKLLVSVGVLDRLPYQDKPVRYEYHLSEKGRDLYPQTVAIHEWADRWLIKKGAPPLILRHTPCDQLFVSEMVCSNCVQPLVAFDILFEKEVRHRQAV